jgi:hypothetical protein
MTRIRLIIRVMPVSRRDRDRHRHSDRDSAWPGLESDDHDDSLAGHDSGGLGYRHLEGWVMLYNTPPCYITGCYVAFMLYNTFFMLYNIPGCVI